MNLWAPLLRFMAAILAVAFGLRLIVELLAPIAVPLATAAVTACVLYLAWLIRGRRDRW
jgi:hypothetical protein